MPSRELRGFIKTGLLKPGGCEEVQIRTKIADWASYDESLSAYVLLPGEYELFLGNSIRDTERIGSLRIEQERVVQQLRRRCAPRKLSKRLRADGPAGFRVRPGRGVCTTAWPVATLIACSWDAELACQIGRAGAQEVRENNCAMWLTPGINIHRNPCGGRNFEYYFGRSACHRCFGSCHDSRHSVSGNWRGGEAFVLQQPGVEPRKV